MPHNGRSQAATAAKRQVDVSPRDQHVHPGPTVLVIFGVAGDLTWRKLVPALYHLYLDRWLPEQFAVIGVDQKEMSDDELRPRLRDGVDRFSRRGNAEDEVWNAVAPRMSYIRGDLGDSDLHKELAKRLADLEKEWNTQANFIFYLAVPPTVIETIVNGLSGARLTRDHARARARIVVEKPYGHDWQPNRLIIRIQPDEGITQYIQAKQLGPALRLRPVQTGFSYCETFKADPPEAYETLLLDVMRGDPTLFMRADQVEAAWFVLTPIFNVWDTVPPIDFPNYSAGTWGPEAAAALVVPDGG